MALQSLAKTVASAGLRQRVKGSGYRTTSHGTSRIKCCVCHSSSTVLVAQQLAFTSAEPMVFGSALILTTVFVVVVLARFNSWDLFFFTFLCLGLGLRFRV